MKNVITCNRDAAKDELLYVGKRATMTTEKPNNEIP